MGLWEGDSWRWNMSWRRGRLGRERDEEEVLWRVLDNIHLKKGRRDSWTWIHAPGGQYKVKVAYDFLASYVRLLDTHLCKFIWCRLVPSKVSFFGWSLCLDRLPTKRNLQKRGVCLQQEELLYGLRHEVVEEVDHLFCTCREAWLIWVKVLRWWGIETVMCNTVQGITEFFLHDLGGITGKEVSAYIFLVVAWFLWCWRNNCVFNDSMSMGEHLVDRIQMKSFLWIKNKVDGCVFSFYEWKEHPVDYAVAIK
ncbi:hypothetical protein SLEP1_g14612 [Rubroshorea leprosula]|uniref:Reverse transcriptase zinc-binding domain-containing protein n=1 Tax=Rubroshorea leprosula TaxID=152421 RepID=A0AAV5ITN4_9ROSI|nr:hypothetical protein SLEP1_g14612 [Rubroshorea leprosula]